MNMTLMCLQAILRLCTDASFASFASFAVRKDICSHTGAIMMLGCGEVYAASTRQKINSMSSTEAKLVGVNELMGQVLWTRSFLEAQVI